MRAFGILAIGVIASWLIAACIQVGLGLALDAREEMVAAMCVEVVFALLVALVFGVVLAAGGRRRAIAFAALAILVLGVAGLAAIEAFALADEAGTINPSDLPLLIELGLPALVTVALQWLLMRAYLKRQLAPVSVAVPVQG